MSNVEKGTWCCSICNFPPHLLNGRFSDCVCNGSQLIPPPLPAPSAPPPSAAASSATSKKQQKLKPSKQPSTATSSSKKPRTDTSNNNSSLYVNNEEDDGEYIPESIAGNDTAFYSSFSHIYEKSSSGTYASIFGGEMPNDVAARSVANHFQQSCSLDDVALLDLRSSGIPSTAATANSGLKSDNPCVALRSELSKLTIVKFEPLKDLPLCEHIDLITGVQCTHVAVTRKAVDADMTTERPGEFPNNRCYHHMEVGSLVQNCIRNCGREHWKERRLLCIVCEMAKLCKNGCEATIWKAGQAQCIVCEMAKRCKNGCDATIWKAGHTQCSECHGGTACTSCGGPRGLVNTVMCLACRALQICVKCKVNPVVKGSENKCRACHPDYHPCGKCGEFNVVGQGKKYCVDCRPLCKAKGCTAMAKPKKKDPVTKETLIYRTCCGPNGTSCALGYPKPKINSLLSSKFDVVYK